MENPAHSTLRIQIGCHGLTDLAELKCYRHHNLEGDIAPHVVNAPAACHYVLVGIFQSAQVALVGFVQQIVGGDIEFCYLLSLDLCSHGDRHLSYAKIIYLRNVICRHHATVE